MAELGSSTYRGMYRATPLSCSLLTRNDLRTLFERLEEKGLEGLNLWLSTFDLPEGNDPEEFEDLKDQARAAFELTVVIIGHSGEQLVTTSVDGMSDANLPDRISSVQFDSASALQNATNLNVLNRFTVRLDFSQPPNFARYDPTVDATPNMSQVEVTGPDQTWVSGVHDMVVGFFETRATSRSWLHNPMPFLVSHWLLVLPACIWGSYRAVQQLPADFVNAHPVLSAGLYLYGFYLFFVALRMLKMWARRAWPYLEVEGESKTVGRVSFSAVALGAAGALIYDLFKQVLLP